MLFFFYLHIIAPIYFYSQLISYYTWPILSWLLWCYKRTEYITYQKEEKNGNINKLNWRNA